MQVFNMRKILFLFLLLFVGFSSFGQLTSYKWHTFAKFSVGKIDSATYLNGGLSAEYMLFKHIGLNYNLEFQHRTDSYNHLHGSIGSVGGPVIFALGAAKGILNAVDGDTTNNTGIGALGMLAGILVFVLPDGVSYHIPIGYKGDLSPYFNFLGFDWVRNKRIGYSEFKYACSLGIRGTYMLSDRLTAIGFVETRKCAPTGWGIGGGIGLGYLFKIKKDDQQFMNQNDPMEQKKTPDNSQP